MGALPKRKYAKARQGKRRSHLRLSPPSLDYCGREVVEAKGPKISEKETS